MTFFKLQRLFKFLTASALGTLNVIAFLTIVRLSEKAVACAAIAANVPEQLSKPIAIDLAGIIDIGVNFVTRVIQSTINFIVFCFHGHNFISIPALDLPGTNLTLPVSPVQIIPFFSDPSNILHLCNYTNIGAGIAAAVIVTAVLSVITTTIVTSDIPKQVAKFVNRRLAKRAVKLMNKLINVIEKIEPDLLDDPVLVRMINHAKSIINDKKRGKV